MQAVDLPLVAATVAEARMQVGRAPHPTIGSATTVRERVRRVVSDGRIWEDLVRTGEALGGPAGGVLVHAPAGVPRGGPGEDLGGPGEDRGGTRGGWPRRGLRPAGGPLGISYLAGARPQSLRPPTSLAFHARAAEPSLEPS
jgi:hypothetical protein